MRYEIDPKNDLPIYRQIAAGILKDIKTGVLPAGVKLPTVRELAEETGLSQGTIKHAYDYLESQDAVEMTQGKGTFVRSQQHSDAVSRKDQAMTAIDNLFCELEDLGFTPREMEIYINLKLHGLEERYDLVKVAVIDCNPETLQRMESQLSQINYAQVAIFSLAQIAEIADKLNSDYDVILTTSTHFAEVEPYIHDKQKFGMMAMMPSVETIMKLAKISPECEGGILCASDNFAGVIRKNCADMGTWSEFIPVHLFGSGNDVLSSFLENKTVVILPKNYEVFASSGERQILQSFQTSGGVLLSYDYTIDRGSLLYVENMIKKVMNTKRSV